MRRVGRRSRLAALLRSFAIQGSWNYRTLIGGGFGFALLPVLRDLYSRDPARLDEAVERHTRLFNSHPYLAPMALGAVAVLEAEGEDAQVVDRFKSAIRGSLGTLGDGLVWAAWRPVCLLLAIALLLAGARWWIGLLGFLLVYNAGHLRLRYWAYRIGFREGKGIGERLRRSRIAKLQRGLLVVGAFLAGAVVPLAAAGTQLDTGGLGAEGVNLLPWPWTVAAVGAALLGVRLGPRLRPVAVVALFGITLLGLLSRILQ